MELSDATLIAKVQDGDSELFGVLVERHSRLVFRIAFRITANEADAEDVVQESFVRAYRRLREYDGRASFATWVCRIATNCALDLIAARKRKRTESLESAGEDAAPIDAVASSEIGPERLAASAQLRCTIDAAMGALTAQERTAFVLRHHEGLPLEEISRTLGIGMSATKHSVFRAVQKLRLALAPVV